MPAVTQGRRPLCPRMQESFVPQKLAWRKREVAANA
jgi:hypothetical protein